MERLEIRADVQRLAVQVFDQAEWDEIQNMVANLTVSRKQKQLVLSRLEYIVPLRPKRPLYYVNGDLWSLPKNSRFLVEDMGSYLDLSIKEWRFELEGEYPKYPLGRNIYALRKNADAEMNLLLDKLELFNEIAYVPAKHKYGPPNDTGHYFNLQEAVIIILAAVKLGEELKKRSDYVRKLCQDLVLPAQEEIVGHWERTDQYGIPFDFKERLSESRKLCTDPRA